MENSIDIDSHGGNEIFAVVTVYHKANSEVENFFPKEINEYLSKGWYIGDINVTPNSDGGNSIAFLTLRHS